jgi:hypothetical protein
MAAAPRAGDHQAFLRALAGERHGRAMLVIPVSGTPGRPVELDGSAGYHQVHASMASGRRAYLSIGRCRSGDEDAVYDH